jgi:hypothetical protein
LPDFAHEYPNPAQLQTALEFLDAR